MLNTKNVNSSAVVALTFAVLGPTVGCSMGSDRTINLPGKDLKMGTPAQVQPPGATIAAFSQDGRNYAVQLTRGFEVRSYEGKTLFSETKSVNQPLMFTNGGSRLVCMEFLQLDKDHVQIVYSSLDWSSGQYQKLPINVTESDESAGMIAFVHRYNLEKNTDQNLLWVGTHVVLETGAVIPLPKGYEFAGWGPDGVLILFTDKDKRSYLGVWPDGTVRQRQRPIDSDSRDAPVHRRNEALTVETVYLQQGRSQAYLSGLWLKHYQAKSGEGQRDSALVGAGYDMTAFGFVPGHDAVWYNADDGSFVVPYTTEPSNE